MSEHDSAVFPWIRGNVSIPKKALDRIAEFEALGLHDEGDGIAMRAAAEAMVMRLVVVIDVEGRALLVVEGAKAGRLLAAAREAHLLAD